MNIQVLGMPWSRTALLLPSIAAERGDGPSEELQLLKEEESVREWAGSRPDLEHSLAYGNDS